MHYLRAALIALIAVATSLSIWLMPPAPPAPRPALSCLTPALIEAIRTDPATFDAQYAACRTEIAALLGAASDAEGALVFASLAAYRMAPYGRSLAIELDALLAEPVLDCDNYAWLAMQLYQQSAHAAGRLRFVAWDHPRVRLHAQVALTGAGGRGIVVDPTVNLVIRAPLADVLSGRPIAADDLILLESAWDDPPNVARFRARLLAALQAGDFAPAHLYEVLVDPRAQMERSAAGLLP